MRVGYGRGYYGNGQLAPSAPRPKTSWFKVVAIIGVGAAIVWMLLPRSSASALPMGGGGGGKDPDPPTPPAPLKPPAVSELVVATTTNVPTDLPAAAARSAPIAPIATSAAGAFMKQLEDDARARGYVSVNDYEDSVIATAKQLQSAGAKVVLAPHLEHLTPRLEP
jgi:hypothetical protein